MQNKKFAKKNGMPIEEYGKSSMRKFLIRAVYASGTFLLGLLLSGAKAPLDTYPFIIALTSSLTSCAGFASLGVLCRLTVDGSIGTSAFTYCAAAILVCAARWVFCFLFIDKSRLRGSGRLTDDVLTRVLTACIASIGGALVTVFVCGFDTVTIMGGVFSACASGAMTFLFVSLFDRRYFFPSAYEVGGALLLFGIALSLADIKFHSVSLSLVFAFGAVLWCGYCGGWARGCAAGFIAALGCGGELGVELAFFGLLSGLFFPVNAVAASAAGLIAAITYGAVSGGAEKVLSFLPEALIGTSVITVSAILKIMPKYTPTEESSAGVLCHDITEKKREEDRVMKLKLLSEAMASLSHVIKNISERMRRPDETSLASMCRAVWAEKCSGCPIDCPCKNMSSISSDTRFERFVSKLMTAGKLPSSRLSELTRCKCPKSDEIIDEINLRTSKMIEYALKFDKTGVFAFDYGTMSQMMSDAVSQSGVGYTIDRTLSERLSRALLRAGLAAENVVVCGDRKKYIVATGTSLLSGTLGTEDIRKICEDICGTKFLSPEYTVERGCAAMTLECAKSYGVSYAGKQSEKDGERVCGDSVSVTESADGCFYCFICDGMGSGETAALTSRVCRVFLEKMLACGNDKTTTLEMLNMFLKNRGAECFATIDLLEIDMHTGTAAFIKSGAAPSYIVRGKNLYKISSGTLPVGILSDISAEITEFDLKTGDVIVMVSDGICGDPEFDGTWLSDYLTKEMSSDLTLTAEKIMMRARKEDKRSDDMTVELIRIDPPTAGARDTVPVFLEESAVWGEDFAI